MAFATMAASALLYQPAKAGWTVEVTAQSSPADAPVIEVESNGVEWTNIKGATQAVTLSTEVEVSSGWRVMKVYLGFPSADLCPSPDIEGCSPIYDGETKHVKLDGRTNAFRTEWIGGLDELTIVGACNAGGHDPRQEREPFESRISLGIKAFIVERDETEKHEQEGGGEYGRTETAFTTAPAIVRCLAPAQGIQKLDPASVDLRVKQKGETCPKDTEITASIDYEHKATARFRIMRNGVPSAVITADTREVTFGGKTWHRIDHVKNYALDPGEHNFRVKVIGGGESKKETVSVNCPPFQATSMWLSLDTENKSTCPKTVDASVSINGNGPGSVLTKIKNQAGAVMAIESIKVEREGDQYVGRLTKAFNMTAIDTMLIAEDANDAALNSGWQPLKIECIEALSGKLTLQSLGPTSCKGEALVAIHTSGAGELPYELECGPGKSWQRKVTAMANKIGVDKVRFDVTNNERVTCALRTRIGGVAKPLDGTSMTFQCHKPAGVSDVDDFVPDTRPDSQKPSVPGTIVIDPPRPDAPKPENPGTAVVDPPRPTVGCVNGRVVNGACDCERTMTRVKVGKNAWRCVIDPKPEPTVSEPKISCAGGTPKNGTCACARTHKPVKAGKNAWRCVKAVVVDPPRNKAGASTSGAKIKTDAKPSTKKGKAKKSATGRSSSAPR
jgi:hypothetical protein